MNYFKNIDLFQSLSPEQQETLSLFCQRQWLEDGETLFYQGDEAQAMYLILEGKLNIMKDGEYITQLWAGDIVWEIAFIKKDQRRNASIVASWEAQLITIIDFSIQKIFEENPELYEKIKRIIEARSG